MLQKTISLLFTVALFLPTQAQAELALDVGVSRSSDREFHGGIPDLGLELMAQVIYQPTMIVGTRFSYNENLLNQRLVRDFNVSTPFSFAVMRGLEFSVYPKLTFSKIAKPQNHLRWSVHLGTSMTIFPLETNNSSSSTISTGLYTRFSSEWGLEFSKAAKDNIRAGLAVGYRF